jgi:predicted transcriptional regulator
LKAKFANYGDSKMNKKSKIRITTDGTKGFFGRAREHARKLDRGEALAPEITISFENASDMMKVLSPERVRILGVAKKGPASVSNLAAGLNRDTRAVSRDVDLLEQFGLLSTHYQANPGHGRLRIVVPRASRYQLVATV